LLLRTAVRAGIWAARRSGGLVDPTLSGALERAGYATSLDGSAPASLTQALATAPARKPARAHPERRWQRIAVDDPSATVRRPAGVALDTGGTGKGLCADAVAHRLAGYTRFVVDCGGDLAIGGVGAQLEPYEIEVEHPLTGEAIRTLLVAAGGVATSGLNVRLWQDSQGGFAHHLLDPATGLPAWTGLIGATALAPSALEAETLAKMALLLGPVGARHTLAEHGGLIVHDDGDVEEIGSLDRARGVLALTGRAA
jgi:FAD:protein FMN transferase